MSSLEQGIETLMKEVDVDCKIVKFENIAAFDNFSILLRTKMVKGENWNDTCNKWLEKFSIQTNSKWVVKATFPRVQRIEYRKVYVCKENSISNRNQDKSCPAKVDIKVKKISVHTLKRDKLLRSGYNTAIKVCFIGFATLLLNYQFLGRFHALPRTVTPSKHALITTIYFTKN